MRWCATSVAKMKGRCVFQRGTSGDKHVSTVMAFGQCFGVLVRGATGFGIEVVTGAVGTAGGAGRHIALAILFAGFRIDEEIVPIIVVVSFVYVFDGSSFDIAAELSAALIEFIVID